MRPKQNLLRSFEIEDALDGQGDRAIEITLTLNNGARRWCFVTTPAGLANFGDWVEGTRTRFHHGCAHMIVIAAPLNRDLIDAALMTIDREGGLLDCTLPLAE